MYRGKQSKKRNNLQYIHRFMYIFIYIYLYSNFCSVSCCFWTTITLLYFSHVNLQLKVGANGDEVLGILVPVVVLPPLCYFTWHGKVGWVKDMSDCSNKPLEKHWLCQHLFKFFQSNWGGGQSKRAHSLAIRDTRHMTFNFSCYC